MRTPRKAWAARRRSWGGRARHVQRATPGTPPCSSVSPPGIAGVRTGLRRGLVLALASLLLAAGLTLPQPLAAQNAIQLLSSEVESRFPEGISFRVAVSAPAPVTEITLQYRVLGESVGRYNTFEFESARSAQAELLVRTDTADRYIPPGAEIEFFYDVVDEDGNRTSTPPQTFTLLDPRFEWQRIEGDKASILYYRGAERLAQEVLETSENTLERMGALLGVQVEEPLKLTMYNNFRDMRVALPPRSQVQESALVVEGISFGSTGVVLVLGDIARVKGVTAHEVVHFLVDQAMGGVSRLVPAWLNEGLAEFGSSEPSPTFDLALAAALSGGELLPLTSLTAPPGQPNDVILFYGESKSAVTYMVENYGEEAMQRLLAELRQGLSIDSALEAAYGFDRVELENRWRESIGAEAVEAQASVRPTAIPLPTIVPFGVATPTTSSAPTPSAPQPAPTPTSPPPAEESSGGCGAAGPSADLALILVPVAAAVVLRGQGTRALCSAYNDPVCSGRGESNNVLTPTFSLRERRSRLTPACFLRCAGDDAHGRGDLRLGVEDVEGEADGAAKLADGPGHHSLLLPQP